MLSPDNKRRLIIVAVFLVPVILVKGTSVYYGVGSPAGASAAVTPAPTVDAPIDLSIEQAWTAQQKAAATYAADLHDAPFGQSPLYYQLREPSNGDGPVVQVDPSLPNLIVQAIVESASGATVLMNNQRYRVGDTFDETAWVITDINNDTRTVTLRNSKTGKTVEAAVRIER